MRHHVLIRKPTSGTQTALTVLDGVSATSILGTTDRVASARRVLTGITSVVSAGTAKGLPPTGFVLMTANNTGLVGAGVSEGSLTSQGATTVSGSGQVFEGRRFTGRVNVTGSNNVFRKCLFNPPAGADLTTHTAVRFGGGTGNLMEDCTFRPQSGSGFNGIYAQAGSFTIRRCDIGSFQNNVSLDTDRGDDIHDCLFEHSYLHDASNVSSSGGHRDCVEVYAGTNITFYRCTLIHPAGETATVNVAPYQPGTYVDGLLIDQCYLDGGGSGTILRDLQGSALYIRNLRVRDCFFGGHTRGDWNHFWNLDNYDAPGIATSEAALAANPNRILWMNNTYLYTQNSPFGYYNHSTNRDGQAAAAGVGP